MFMIDKADELDKPIDPQVDASLKRLEIGYSWPIAALSRCSPMTLLSLSESACS
jgi:hypothetical protein